MSGYDYTWIRRCPDGTETTDVDKYCDAWTALGERACRFFPGFVVAGYNPDIVIELRRTLENGCYVVDSRIALSVQAINILSCPHCSEQEAIHGRA